MVNIFLGIMIIIMGGLAGFGRCSAGLSGFTLVWFGLLDYDDGDYHTCTILVLSYP